MSLKTRLARLESIAGNSRIRPPHHLFRRFPT